MARSNAKQLGDRLAGLAADPDQQRALALELVATDRRPSVFIPALRIIGDPVDELEQDALLSLYQWLDESGVTRDLNAETRIRILRSLRSAGMYAPRSLLERAVKTVEHAPPGGIDEAAGLRAAALISLLDVDEELAGYHAARLLIDPETSGFSGEPAVTAATVLTTLGQRGPLYAFAMQPNPGLVEVLAEVLSALVDAPDSIVIDVVEHLLPFDDEPAVASVYELMLRRDDQHWTSRIETFLATEERPHLLRYVATTIAAERREWQIELLRQRTAAEPVQKRQGILDEALKLVAPG
ncbi:hypothetical protein BH23CHL4_BH23CHL4_13430 [soil metagenome]